MMRAGMIKKLGAGIYTYMPMGLRVIRKVEAIVREEMNRAGAVELTMPVVQPSELWEESGRFQAYGPELLRIKDRHERGFVVQPTSEEVITDIARQELRSYRQLPRNFYHIQTKFRDERRPRFGVMRGREFTMKDAYSFDRDLEAARRSYRAMYDAYCAIFDRMHLTYRAVAADTGAIGGDLSHEFIVLAPTGESEVFYDAAFEEFDWNQADLQYGDAEGLQRLFDQVGSTYSATDETHDEGRWAAIAEDRRRTGRGIEVGHIFYFGDKYSAAMGLKVSGADGKPVTPMMGSYGVGVSRLVGAIIEASHDDAGIVWPESVAPWKVGIVTMRQDDEPSVAAAEELYASLQLAGVERAYDDREERGGAKLATMDLIGLPWQVIVGPRGIAAGTVELKRRSSGERQELSVESALARLTE